VGLPVGGEMTVELALQALIIKSANDVAVMLAEAVSGSEQAFVAKMNETAKRLGMTRSNFVNPNGLPAPEQVTTARDLAKLSNAILANFPEYARYWSMPDMRLGKRRLGSHNALLRTFEGADGLKTGFTCDSGFNVVASATRNGKRLMAVVLGEPSGNERALRAASLLEHGFMNQGWKSVFDTTSLESMPVPPEARGIISVRDTVIAWDCGNRRVNIAKRNKELKRKVADVKARAKAKAQANKKSSESLDLKATTDASEKAQATAESTPKPPPANQP
jgi:D-alanyl-D-alanine carboxypeptidase